MKTNTLMLMGLIVLCSGCQLWKKKQRVVATPVAATVKPPTTLKGPKPYKEVITDKALTSAGLFKVHRLDDRYFFEIPNSLLDREILLVNRISRAAAAIGANVPYGGDEIANTVISFEKGPNNKLFIKKLSFDNRSTDSTTNGMQRSLKKSNVQPLVAAFNIKALARDSISKAGSTVIDVTDYLNADDNLFSPGELKKQIKATAIAVDRSYIDTVKTFQKNIEIQTVSTYGTADGNLTCELNSSLVLLPLKPMCPRWADE